MIQVIHCDNPNCGTRIEIPPGAVKVTCPRCNTWLYPSVINRGQSEGYGDDWYGQPEAPPLDSHEEYGLPPLPPTEEEAPIEEPTSPPQRGDSREVGSIGYLQTIDGTRLSLRRGKNLIGRRNADLEIKDNTVSRRHCIIEVNMTQGGQGWEFLIYDIGHEEEQRSTNGVFISGRSLRLQNYERIPIYHDTSIRLGNVILVLKCQ
ncbi:MAG: FHA domain-containing protein [Bacteroidota bacterium]